MEDEEDDFYNNAQDQEQDYAEQAAPEREVKMETSDDQDEDEDDSDDDVQFTLEKPEGVKSESTATSRPKGQQTASQDRKTSQETKPARTETPSQDQRATSTQPTAIKGTLTHNGKEGKDYPELRTSKLDINGTPIWPATGKPITEVDIDADLAEHSKPWRLPGTDLTDFFNYGFDEYTWAQYCVRQREMAEGIAEGKQRDAQMKAFFEGQGGMPGGGQGGPPGGMPPMPGMPGMPPMEEMIQQMMAAGYDPQDQNQFMQFMMNNMGGGMGGSQGPQGGGGFGRGHQSTSPRPGPGQGFQPPQGPGGQHGGGDFGGNMEGYSAQQMAIMQGHGPQGGRGRGRGRGRW